MLGAAVLGAPTHAGATPALFLPNSPPRRRRVLGRAAARRARRRCRRPSVGGRVAAAEEFVRFIATNRLVHCRPRRRMDLRRVSPLRPMSRRCSDGVPLGATSAAVTALRHAGTILLVAGRRCEDGSMAGDRRAAPRGWHETTRTTRARARGAGGHRRRSQPPASRGRQPTAAASRDTSPVDLATPIDMAAGMAHRSAIVHVGDVRVEVLSSEPAPSRVLAVAALREQPDGERPRPADAGPSLLRLHHGGLADRPHGQRHPALQAGVGTLHPAQHLAPTVGRRPDIHGGADVGMGVHLRPGVPGRRGHPGRGSRPQPDLSPGTRAPRATRGSSSSREPASPGTSSGPRPARRLCRCATTTWRALRWHRPRAPSTWRSTASCGRSSTPLPTTAAEPWATFTTTVPLRGGDQLHQGGQHHSEQLRSGHRHPGRRSRRFAASRPGVDRTPRRVVPGVRHRHLQRHTDLRARTVRCHLPGRHPAPQHRRAAGHGRLASARRHPERAVDHERMGRTPAGTTATSRTGTSSSTDTTTPAPCTPWPSSPVPRPCFPGTSSVCGTPTTRPIRATPSRTRSIPSSSPTTSPSTPSRSTPTGRRRTIGTAGNGTAPSSPSPSSFLGWARSHGIDVTLNIHSSIDDNDPKLPRGRTHRRTRPRLVQLYQRELQGLGLELDSPGRVQLRPPAELSAPGGLLLVARLVLRRLGRLLAGRDARCVDRPSLRPGHGQPRRARLRPGPHRGLQCRSAGGVPGGAMVGPHLDHRLHRRRLGNVEHPGRRGGPGPRRGHASASPT